MCFSLGGSLDTLETLSLPDLLMGMSVMSNKTLRAAIC